MNFVMNTDNMEPSGDPVLTPAIYNISPIKTSDTPAALSRMSYPESHTMY